MAVTGQPRWCARSLRAIVAVAAVCIVLGSTFSAASVSTKRLIDESNTHLTTAVEAAAALASDAGYDGYGDAVDAAIQLADERGIFLAIGVKSSVLRGVEVRQAIRQTWGDPTSASALRVRVLFLGCQPDLSSLSATKRQQTEEAIAYEKETYQDLLTDELQCQDSFFTLVDKTVAFFDHAYTRFPSLAFAMVVDDDVYVRVDQLVALLRSDLIPQERFYGGNAAEAKHKLPNDPMRRPESRYYIPMDVYPLSQLPPFVAGAQYIVSRDIVRFVARNRNDLRGIKGLDDVTMALWMLALQIHPVYLPQFQIMRMWSCTEDLISYADLSASAIREIHHNLVSGGRYCEGFGYERWSKEYRTINLPNADGSEDGDGDVQFQWDLQLNQATDTLEIASIITVANESVSLMYTPAQDTYTKGYCDRILPLMEAKLSILVGRLFCAHHRDLLLRYIMSHGVTMPTMRPLLQLARHNLERDASDGPGNQNNTLRVGLVVGGDRYVRVVTECLLVAMYPTRQIIVVDDEDLFDGQKNKLDIVVVAPASGVNEVEIYGQLVQYVASGAIVVLMASHDARVLDLHGANVENVVRISSHASSSHPNHVYLPLASAIFGNMVYHSPLELLNQGRPDDPHWPSFCSYDYDGCDQSDHQFFVDLLNDHERVTALGACRRGETMMELPAMRPRSQTPVDDAIDRYKPFKFTVAFEEDDTTPAGTPPGAVNDKFVTAFLAGSIPIYFGHSHSVSWLFNPRAFIDCGKFESLRGCADHVLQVHKTPSLYEAMRREPPVVNETAFMEVFSWHPDVADMAKKTQKTNDTQLLMSHRIQQLIQNAFSGLTI